LAGLRDEKAEALRLIIGNEPLESFTRQEEVADFAEGGDSLPDTPISFAIEKRLFSPRRVKTLQGTGRV
jgi:CRISPR system Cascade subunit CasD